MRTIRALFFDIGGVILSNGWDFEARKGAAEKFSLDLDEMERRHAPLLAPFEKAEIGLEEYLDEVVFYEKRPFTK